MSLHKIVMSHSPESISILRNINDFRDSGYIKRDIASSVMTEILIYLIFMLSSEAPTFNKNG